MMTLKPILLCIALLSIFACAPSAKSEDAAQWTDLLGKDDLSQRWTTKGNWKLEDGVVTLEPRPGEHGWQRYDAYLWLDGAYKDFEIEFEYKLQKGGNSGFYFRVGDVKDPVATGIEVQIHDTADKGEGEKLTDHDSGGIIPGIAPTASTAKPAEQWNRFQISSKGNKLIVKLNGETVNVVDLQHEKLRDRPETGSIGFQDHGLPLALRNIRIRKL